MRKHSVEFKPPSPAWNCEGKKEKTTNKTALRLLRSVHVCVVSPPASSHAPKTHTHVRLTGCFKLPGGVNVSVCGCLHQSWRPGKVAEEVCASLAVRGKMGDAYNWRGTIDNFSATSLLCCTLVHINPRADASADGWRHAQAGLCPPVCTDAYPGRF